MRPGPAKNCVCGEQQQRTCGNCSREKRATVSHAKLIALSSMCASWCSMNTGSGRPVSFGFGISFAGTSLGDGCLAGPACIVPDMCREIQLVSGICTWIPSKSAHCCSHLGTYIAAAARLCLRAQYSRHTHDRSQCRRHCGVLKCELHEKNCWGNCS